MMDIALLLLGIPVCIADLHTFIIPNIYAKILFYMASIHLAFHGLASLNNLLLTVSILLALMILKLGMGDIKILALILITHNIGALDLLGYVFLLAVLHIMVLTGINRKIPSKIALAPSIFIGFATYMATR
jgi:hypothetical protein